MTIYLDAEYIIFSNRESGFGRYDIALIPRDVKDNLKGMIMEFKRGDESEQMDQLAEEALEQIKTKEYKTDLIKHGVTEIIEYGMAFHKKEVRIKMREVQLEKIGQ